MLLFGSRKDEVKEPYLVTAFYDEICEVCYFVCSLKGRSVFLRDLSCNVIPRLAVDTT
jgi:hypothetical protein